MTCVVEFAVLTLDKHGAAKCKDLQASRSGHAVSHAWIGEEGGGYGDDGSIDTLQ